MKKSTQRGMDDHQAGNQPPAENTAAVKDMPLVTRARSWPLPKRCVVAETSADSNSRLH